MIHRAQNARVKDEEREIGNFLVIVAQMCFNLGYFFWDIKFLGHTLKETPSFMFFKIL